VIIIKTMANKINNPIGNNANSSYFMFYRHIDKMDIYVVARHKNLFINPRSFGLCINEIITDDGDLAKIAQIEFGLKCDSCIIHKINRRMHECYGDKYPKWVKNINKSILVECVINDVKDIAQPENEWIACLTALECLSKCENMSMWVIEAEDGISSE
jgi:hypothetical protein